MEGLKRSPCLHIPSWGAQKGRGARKNGHFSWSTPAGQMSFKTAEATRAAAGSRSRQAPQAGHRGRWVLPTRPQMPCGYRSVSTRSPDPDAAIPVGKGDRPGLTGFTVSHLSAECQVSKAAWPPIPREVCFFALCRTSPPFFGFFQPPLVRSGVKPSLSRQMAPKATMCGLEGEASRTTD